MSNYLESIKNIENSQGRILPTSPNMTEITVEERNDMPPSITSAISGDEKNPDKNVNTDSDNVHYLAKKKVSVRRYKLKK